MPNNNINKHFIVVFIFTFNKKVLKFLLNYSFATAISKRSSLDVLANHDKDYRVLSHKDLKWIRKDPNGAYIRYNKLAKEFEFPKDFTTIFSKLWKNIVVEFKSFGLTNSL